MISSPFAQGMAKEGKRARRIAKAGSFAAFKKIAGTSEGKHPWPPAGAGVLGLKELTNRLRSIINQRKWTRLRAGQVRFKVQAKTMVNRGDDLIRTHRTFHWISSNFVAFPDDTPALDPATGK